MGDGESRIWMTAEAQIFRLRLRDVVIEEGPYQRRVRRVEFQNLDGLPVGEVVVPGYFSLDLATAAEIEELWRRLGVR